MTKKESAVESKTVESKKVATIKSTAPAGVLFTVKEGATNVARRRWCCLSCKKEMSAPDHSFPECCGFPMVGKEFDERTDQMEVDIIRFLLGREPNIYWPVLLGEESPRDTINEQMPDGRWWSGCFELWWLKGLGRGKGERIGWIRVLPGVGWQWKMVPGVTPTHGIGGTAQECVEAMMEAICNG